MKYPDINDIIKEKEELINLGEDKLRELSNLRVKLEAERLKNNIEEVEKLEEEEQKIVADILRLDNKIKILEALEYIYNTKLFKRHFNIIEGLIPYEELIYMLLENDLKLKKTLLEIYKKLEIDDKEVLEEIENIPEENGTCESEECKENKFIEQLVNRIKKISKYLKE
ncbi:hypothetical protein [Methanocaldococcus infernus]|uniref:Uncharacterized protein n=1 Tax=Methanocaldococcus infernus (strain DSM 11812 / JCM 15783 / ME) TaxID=573063 RepID=D5VRW8_METIM|nr:hypothetical protein [Methanocaldococcus infernus]ADG13321.1 conserved hypothetical protein [Methanocaldococcus infernus ME]